MHRILLAFLFAWTGIATASAQDMPPASVASVHDIAAVVVRGVQPGPGLWKVSKGDHALWILGTLSPLPKDITWDSHRVEILVASSQEVLVAPSLQVRGNLGFFGTLALLPSLIGLRNNPDGAMLRDVVSPDLYARWSVLKEKYIGGGNKVEKWRPIFAAIDLYDAAIRKAGLTDKLLVQKTVAAAAKHAGVKVMPVIVTFVLDDPRSAVKEFKATALDDSDCFRKTLDRVDTDLAAMTARANAWSVGDLDALRKLSYTSQMAACHAALSETQLARKRGILDIDTRVRKAWLEAAMQALGANQETFATLPISNLLSADGYLSQLRAAGYSIEEPASKSPATSAADVDAATARQ